jgi:hypothetical protein
MSRLTASNLPVVCGVGAGTSTRNVRKGTIQHRYRHAATARWWTEWNHIPPTIEVADNAKKEMQKTMSQRASKTATGRMFSSSHSTPE